MPRSAQDLTGKTFNQLLVLAPRPRMGKDLAYTCRCSCGAVVDVRAGALTSGNTKSCGCRKRTRPDVTVDITGMRFERLLVLFREGSTGGGVPLWRCLCDCGAEVVVRGGHLRSGNTKSCGCRKSEAARLTNRKHGMAHTLAYKRWESIKQRTTNPGNPSYRNYGARGISMHPEWAASFDAFYAAVGDPPFDGASLDRIDNDGNYEPGNVRWADTSTQMRNRRRLGRPSRAQVEALEARIAELETLLAQAKTAGSGA